MYPADLTSSLISNNGHGIMERVFCGVRFAAITDISMFVKQQIEVTFSRIFVSPSDLSAGCGHGGAGVG